MTAPTVYTTLDSDDLGANKILRAATMSALDSNPVAIAQRGTGAPWLNGIGAIEAITNFTTSNVTGNYTVPDGVYRMKITAVGGGGGGIGGGGDTTFLGITAGHGYVSGAGGVASGGDININGQNGNGVSGITYSPLIGVTIGYGGTGGGAGATSIGVVSVEPGDVIAYQVGGGGSSGAGGADGSAGIIIIEY